MITQPDTTILTAGPSLADYREHPAIGRCIAVNRASMLFSCDWLVAGDIDMCERLYHAGVLPRAGFCTLNATRDLWQDRCPEWHQAWHERTHPIIAWESLPGHGSAWCRPGLPEGFSLNAAIALDTKLAQPDFHPPGAIHLFGHDATDSRDCAGGDGDNRSTDRWRREADELASLLAATNRTILRHHPDGSVRRIVPVSTLTEVPC